MDALLGKSGARAGAGETSAALHVRKEAERLAGTPFPAVLMAVAEHAEQQLARLPVAMRQPGNGLGATAGRAFSIVRDLIVEEPSVTLHRRTRGRGAGGEAGHAVELRQAWRVG